MLAQLHKKGAGTGLDGPLARLDGRVRRGGDRVHDAFHHPLPQLPRKGTDCPHHARNEFRQVRQLEAILERDAFVRLGGPPVFGVQLLELLLPRLVELSGRRDRAPVPVDGDPFVQLDLPQRDAAAVSGHAEGDAIPRLPGTHHGVHVIIGVEVMLGLGPRVAREPRPLVPVVIVRVSFGGDGILKHVQALKVGTLLPPDRTCRVLRNFTSPLEHHPPFHGTRYGRARERPFPSLQDDQTLASGRVVAHPRVARRLFARFTRVVCLGVGVAVIMHQILQRVGQVASTDALEVLYVALEHGHPRIVLRSRIEFWLCPLAVGARLFAEWVKKLLPDTLLGGALFRVHGSEYPISVVSRVRQLLVQTLTLGALGEALLERPASRRIEGGHVSSHLDSFRSGVVPQIH